MAKKKKNKKKGKGPALSDKTKRIIIGMVFVLFSIITGLGLFDMAGRGGEITSQLFDLIFGKASLLIPLVFFCCAIIFFKTKYNNFALALSISSILFVTGVSGILTGVSENGGYWGRITSYPLEFFGGLVSQIIFICATITGVVIFLNLLYEEFSLLEFFKKIFSKKEHVEPSVMRRIFLSPSFEAKNESIPVKKRDKKESKKEKEEVAYTGGGSRFPGLIPPLELLHNGDEDPDPGDTRRSSSIIKKTLGDFDIPVTMGDVNVGPTVTQYTLKPAEGIKLSRITSLSDDLALALAMHPVRTEAPIPGKSLVGIEVPNRKRAQITLGGLIKSKTFNEAESSLTIVVGKDVAGDQVYADLTKMPHLLVSGSTGSGKTIFLNTLILSLLYKNSPEELRLIMVDPKRVEFSLYANIPHLLTPVICDAEKTTTTLQWLIGEMERRFKVLAEAGKRNISSYHELIKKEQNREKMPYIVLIVDELADLMAAKGNEIEGGIVRIAQMARAVGIHLVLATQRPSVEVITGLIKANITSRISFRVASQIDSRTVLDMGGAEKLLGSGDMLMVSTENSKPRRVQAPYVSEKEAKTIVNWLRENSSLEEEDNLAEKLQESLQHSEENDMYVGEEGDDDALYDDARKIVIESKKASASLLQRRLRVGYVRAARLLDILERRGIVGPADGAKPRDIYVNNDEDEDGLWDKV